LIMAIRNKNINQTDILFWISYKPCLQNWEKYYMSRGRKYLQIHVVYYIAVYQSQWLCKYRRCRRKLPDTGGLGATEKMADRFCTITVWCMLRNSLVFSFVILGVKKPEERPVLTRTINIASKRWAIHIGMQKYFSVSPKEWRNKRIFT
jgi:hypothetical protein